jgi:hypothetical protein
MSEFFGWFAFKAAEYDAAFAVDFHGPALLLANAAGQRFCDETGYEVHERLRALVNVKPALGYYPALPALRRLRRAYPAGRRPQRRGGHPERLPLERRQRRRGATGLDRRGAAWPDWPNASAWIRPCSPRR